MTEPSVELHERMAKLETNMEHVLDKLMTLTEDTESLKGVIWKATGGAVTIIALLQFLFKGH
jgi:hypothetical protein